MKSVSSIALVCCTLVGSGCEGGSVGAGSVAHPAMARYADPTVLDGSAYAGCWYEKLDAADEVVGNGRFDDRGHAMEVEERGETHRYGWRGDQLLIHDFGRGGRRTTEVGEWDADGLLASVRDSLGNEVVYTYASDGLRTDELRSGDGASVETIWTWSGDVAEVETAGAADVLLAFWGDRLESRAVGSELAEYVWVDDELVGWSSTGLEVERTLSDGRVESEHTNGSLSARWVWDCQ